MKNTIPFLLALSFILSCAPKKDQSGNGSALLAGGAAAESEPLNPDALFAVVYEVQVRSANACRVDTGSPAQRQACAQKVAPNVKYRAESWAGGYDCENDNVAKQTIADLQKVKLGTFEDMLENTSDYRVGITLRYIKEKVGANTVWVMPMFPNNDKWNIPARCDNVGSPYAVRDYLHASGSLSRVCIKANKTEYDVPEEEAPCFGNVSFDKLVEAANAQGLRIMMDVALNHFGHNYRYYDYVDFKTTRERIKAGENLDSLWNFGSTEEGSLVKPEILDSIEKIEQHAPNHASIKEAYEAVKMKCPNFKGDVLVRMTNMYRNMLDWERGQMTCDKPPYLEYMVPGFYAGAGGGGNPHPSRGVGDNFTNNWSDVKFLNHFENRKSDDRGSHYEYFVRNREYFFRIMNYWVSRGVQGFRLDHTTDHDSGMAPNEWRYLIRKVNHYDWLRKGKPNNHRKPIYMAEEFHDQGGMKHVVDAMTEGYVGDMRGGNPKDTAHVQRVLDNAKRFEGQALVLRTFETHDEHRLYDNTGFNEWTGAGFWGIGLTTWSMPMLLMGQEFGERWQLSFRRSDYLRARFQGAPGFTNHAYDLIDFYGKMIRARFDVKNRALAADAYVYLPLKNNQPNDPRLFAIMKWWGHEVVFGFHNLWQQGVVEQAFYIPPDVANAAAINGDLKYKLVNVLSGQQAGDCRTGHELKTNLYVKLEDHERLQWLRLETCN